MDVKSIIQQWYKQLADDAVEFEDQAQRVSVWDQQLRENQKVRYTCAYGHRIWCPPCTFIYFASCGFLQNTAAHKLLMWINWC
jgi:hypothetical protein